MDKELSVIDGILMNLAGILRFYEFEHAQLLTFLNLLKQFQTETIQDDELNCSSEIFSKESNNEIASLEEKLKTLTHKIDKIKADISSRKESKEKLIKLFNALKSIDSYDGINKESSKESPTKFKEGDSKLDSDFPIMEIREDLDEQGNVINSEVKPYQSPENQLKSILQNRKSDQNIEDQKPIQTGSKMESIKNKRSGAEPMYSKNKKISAVNHQKLERNKSEKEEDVILEESDNPKSGNFLPFVIREEIDEDGNIIKSSMSRIPQMKPNDEKNDEDITQELVTPNNQREDEIDEDQLTELFEDMGFTIPKIDEMEIKEKTKDEDKKVTPVLEEDIGNATLKDKESIENSPVPSAPYSVDTDDIYTLELISDELNQHDNADIANDDINTQDFEWSEIDGVHENLNNVDNDDDYDYDDDEEEGEDNDENIQKRVFTNMFGNKGQNLFAEQIMKLRNQNSKDKTILVEEVKDIEEKPNYPQIVEITETDELPKVAKKKVKKSVTFSSTVDVKKVDDIWDDIRRSNIENQLSNSNNNNKGSSTSFFKRSREVAEKETPVDKPILSNNEAESVITDVMERQIIESVPNICELPKSNVFKTFDSISLRKELDHNMTNLEKDEGVVKLSGKKGPSKFKLARVAEMGKKFQETHITAELREELQSIANSISLQNDAKKPALKSNMKSLLPNNIGNPKQEKPYKIDTPKEINPLPVNPNALSEEDYEIVRNETTDNLFDDDDDLPETEFVATNIIEKEFEIENDIENKSKLSTDKQTVEKNDYFPKYEKKTTYEEKEVIGTSLDYKSMTDDLDTMAKAYVLGLYDDDIHTSGEVIEELEDFKKHNQIVEDVEEKKLHDRVTEINKKFEDPNGKVEEILEDNNPMVVSDIVENDMNDILEANNLPDDELDIQLNDETLTNQVALDYTRMRTNMIHKYKGGFRETEKEKEFVRPEGSERVSRFKLARLGGI